MTTSTMAVVFCDVVSSTELRDRLGDTQADAWFRDLLRNIGEAVLEANGSVVKSLGDGVMAVFNSAGAALDAAVAMQHAAVKHGWTHKSVPAQVRVGISIGDVSSIHDDGAADWNGMPVVEAARLCSAAQPEEILAAEVVRILVGSRTGHSMTPLGDYSLKGRSTPMAVVRVAWERPIARSTNLASSTVFPDPLVAARRGPFVGRAALIAELLDTWKAEEWRSLLVAGEPGIGKTRLVSELAHDMSRAGTTVLLGRCDEDLAIAYRPWVEALAPLIETLSDEQVAGLAPEHIQELAGILPALRRRVGDRHATVELDAATRLAVLSDAIGELLRRSAPTVVVLDDMQWIDQASLVAMRHVVADEARGVTILGTYRDTDLDRMHPLSAALADLRKVDGVRRVALDGLDEESVSEFFRVAAGHEIDPVGRDLAGAVHAQTSGNPLFVGEVIRHLAEMGVFSQENRRSGAGSSAVMSMLPEGLREVIGRRLTRLGDDATQALRVGAVIGRSFDADLVEAVLSRDALDDIERAVAAGIIVDTTRAYEFRHAVVRDVLLAELSTARRRRMHRDVVTVLERRWALSIERHLDELAYHHGEAQSASAPTWYLRAAAAAHTVFDGRSAELVERGLELLDVADDDDPTLRCDLLIARARASSRANMQNSLAASREAFAAARALGDQDRMAQALRTAGRAATSDSGLERIDFLRSALGEITDTSLLGRWAAESTLLLNERVGPNLAPADHAARVHEIVRHLDPVDPEARKVAMDCVVGLMYMQQPAQADEVYGRFATPGGTDSFGTPMDVVLAQIALSLGDRDGFERHVSDALGHAQLRRTSWSYESAMFQRIAMRELLDGHWSAAAEAIDEVLRHGGHSTNYALGCQIQRNWIARETGDVEALYQFSVNFLATNSSFPVARALVAAEAAEAGQVDHALAALDELAPDDFAAVGRGWLTILALGSLAWAIITVDARAHAGVLRRLLGNYSGQMARAASGTHVMCSVDRLLAGLAAVDGDHAEADRLFASALAQEEALRSAPLVARTRHWWGRALARRDETELALPLLAAARSAAEQLAMRAVVTQIDDLTDGPSHRRA